MSCTEWKREPSTYDVFFGLELPYQPPKGVVGGFVWRRRVWLETTFALSMMQPWEKVVVVCFFSILFATLLAGMYLYLPRHLEYLRGRATYYLLGHEIGVASAWKWSSNWVTTGNATSPVKLALSLHDDL